MSPHTEQSGRTPVIVTVDVGGTNITVTMFQKGVIKPAREYSYATSKDFDTDFEAIWRAIDDIQKWFGDVAAVSLAVAGRVDSSRIKLSMAGNLTHWVGQPIVPLFEDRFDCKVVLGNDAEAAARADAIYGLGAPGGKLFNVDFIGLGLGSGNGGARIRYVFDQDDELLKIDTIPGEPGHIYVGGHSKAICGCGQTGCMEAYCGADNFPVRFGKSGEELSREEYRQEVYPWLLLGLQSYLRVQPVDVIVYHGSVACGQEWLFPLLKSGLRDFGMDVDFYRSAFGKSAGAIGALSLLTP